jgi:carbon monoxide dehydrogenase subunit G
MIHFEGDRAFDLPLPAVFARLSDASFLVGCLPDANIKERGADRAVWTLKPKLSFLTGGLDAVLEVTEREPEQRAAFKIVTKAIGATSTVLAVLNFTATDTGTAVHWTGDITEVTGLLKMVPKGLLQGTAEKVIEDVWTAVTAQLVERD